MKTIAPLFLLLSLAACQASPPSQTASTPTPATPTPTSTPTLQPPDLQKIETQSYDRARSTLQQIATAPAPKTPLTPDTLPKTGDRQALKILLQHPGELTDMLQQSCVETIQAQAKQVPNFDAMTQALNQYPDQLQHSTAWKVRDRQYLIQLVCQKEPNRQTAALFLYTETTGIPKVQPLRLSTVSHRPPAPFQFEPYKTLAFNSQSIRFDATTQELTILALYSDKNTCGASWIYTIENDNFYLKEFREQTDCDIPGPPANYPKIYP